MTANFEETIEENPVLTISDAINQRLEAFTFFDFPDREKIINKVAEFLVDLGTDNENEEDRIVQRLGNLILDLSEIYSDQNLKVENRDDDCMDRHLCFQFIEQLFYGGVGLFTNIYLSDANFNELYLGVLGRVNKVRGLRAAVANSGIEIVDIGVICKRMLESLEFNRIRE